MLLVNASKGPSLIHGLGLIAREAISEGTRIWVLNPEFDVLLTQAQVDALPPAIRNQVLYYACFFEAIDRYVLSSDDDRFINHSSEPNSISAENGWTTIATRDIAVGEEITWNYFTIGEEVRSAGIRNCSKPSSVL